MFRIHGRYLGLACQFAAPRRGELRFKFGAFLGGEFGRRGGQRTGPPKPAD
jgi:hypothetical protein